MKSRSAVVVGATALLLSVSTALSGPAAADTSWVMPSLRGASLQQATDAIKSLTAPVELKISTYNVTGPSTPQINLTNWFVCGQAPKAGAKVTKKTRVVFSVRRPAEKCS